MIEVRQTPEFRDWIAALRDRQARLRISAHIARLEIAVAGDIKPVGEGVSELRIHTGPGYRLYFVQRGPVVVILLCGGDKKTQARDIVRAKALAKGLDG